MKLRVLAFFCLTIAAAVLPAAAQTDSVITQFTSSNRDSYAGSISGDGRFVVFESTGNLATEDPRNADGNAEIFIWDFAQRRIFQITDTKAVLKNSFGASTQANIKVDVVNKRPVISQNGRWIAFASNATTSVFGTQPNGTNPGRFYGNEYDVPISTQLPCPAPSPSPTPTPTATPTATPTPGGTPGPTPTPVSTPANNPLQCDGNMEIWLYEIPGYGPADLNSGDEVPLTNLSGGAFTLVTNSDPSRYPLDGTATRQPFIADDNHDASINDDGRVVAFASTRDLVAGGNSQTGEEFNDEIFTYVRDGAVTSQITRTPRGSVTNPIYNKNPVISGDGLRVAFASTGDNPIIGMTGGNNPEDSRNEEVFFSDLDSNGGASGTKRQVTATAPATAGAIVNVWSYGKRMSRNGQYIAFDSYADLANEHGGANQAGFATFVYDALSSTFRRVLPRSDADSAATGGDVPRYPGFTDYDQSGAPSTLVLASRLNILPNGTVAGGSDGLNPESTRPVQIYTIPLSGATFSRLTKFPISNTFLAQTQPLTSDTSRRLAFNLGLTELGGGNADLLTEVFYLYVPASTGTSTATLQFATGASALPIIPTASSSPAPTPSPSPSPSPTPVTPAATYGASPGMLVSLNISSGFGPAIAPRTVAGSLTQRPNLPIELSGVSLTINGYAAGMKSVDSDRILFVVPEGLSTAAAGTSYPVVVNNQGTTVKGFLTLVPARPDIFSSTAGPGGRAQASNVTNRVATGEPFTVRTITVKRDRFVPSVIRLRLTGVYNVPAANISIRIGSVTITGTSVISGGILVEPGVQTIDFQLPSSLGGAGDQPVIVTVTAGSTTFTSRLDDTAPRIRIL